ncbi:helix-turn-helix domain-containing protein [Streptomyces sp. NBC_01549]|uniref:nSTAND1 domain-containing NTPase n=1 Tax=unclassified Streptomyces TaxID=2593676 RepID=UPI002252719C|nr:helix-turn-helix domain-containing protein [Streptomyces sp. NBC_01549]MCX4596779.1 helix-turn-helix domain-containing protein [Streptomyces sp. NBC_01549]
MGRQENPVDPGAGPVQRFAYELRKLRQEAGGITYRTMARGTGYSVTTLSRAAAGEQLPSLQVVLAYVAACGGDREEWERRWREAAADEAATAAADDDTDPPPYQGLARFESGDRERFFGRERLASEVLALVRARRFSAVFGPSGSGKSSLLRAGLIPALQTAPLLRTEPAPHQRPAAIRILTPGPHPARTHAALFTAKDGPGETVVVIDQFEEVFTLCTDLAERSAFIDLALTALYPDNRLRVVLAVRADFYGRCAEHDALAQALGATSLLVSPMNPAELREAIVKPAMASGLIVEKALTVRIVEEVSGEPGGLPLMSHALLETWRRRKGRALGETAYDAAGGIHGAIARTAEHIYTQLTPAQGDIARRILLRLITPGEGSQDTRRPADRAELDTGRAEDAAVVLERLARARLLTLDDSTVDLAHEALITAWPRLRSWIDEDRERLLAHRHLTEAARAWHDLGRDPGALYRGTRLSGAEEHFAEQSRAEDLTGLERSFLTASSASRTRERRRLRGLASTLSVLLALALMAGVVAWQQSRTNNRQHIQAEARRIAAVADSMRFSDPVKAMQLSAAAYRLADTNETRSAVLGAMAQREEDVFTPPGGRDPNAQYLLSGDGRTLVSAGKDRVERWDVRTHRRLTSSRSLGNFAGGGDVWMSPDARTLATLEEKGIHLAGLLPAPSDKGLLRSAGAGGLIRFSPSGRTLVADNSNAAESSSVQVWSVRSRRLVFERPLGDEQGITSAAVSPDDRLLALCPEGESFELWDVTRHRKMATSWARGAQRTLCDSDEVQFAPDGSTLVSTGSGGVRLWDVSSGREIQRIKQSGLTWAVISEDGRFIASVADDEILVWRADVPNTPVFRYSLVNEFVSELRIDQQEGVIRYRAGTTGGVVRTLSLRSVLASKWQQDPADAAVFSPDGDTLATARQSKDSATFQLRDGHTGRVRDSLPKASCHDSSVAVEGDGISLGCGVLMAFRPDSKVFAYGSSMSGGSIPPERVSVWDLAEHRETTHLDLALPDPTSGNELNGIAFSPDGKALLASRIPDAEVIEVWDLRRRSKNKMISHAGGEILTFLPDGSRLVTSHSQFIDLKSGRVTQRQFSLDDVLALSVSEDGQYLAAGDGSGRITLWDGHADRRLGVLPGTPNHAGELDSEPVLALAFSPDSRTLATAGSNGQVQLWDVASHQRLGGVLSTPGDSILALSFSRDGSTLYAAGANVPLQRYDIGLAHIVADVCKRARTGLSRADWKTYLPSIPYRKTC